MDEFKPQSRDIALVELLDRVVDHGVVLSGDITISVADVDLIYLGLRLLIRTPLESDLGRARRKPASDNEESDDFLLHLRNSTERG